MVGRVDFLVHCKHAAAQIDAEVVNDDVLALQEGREEVSGEAVSVILVQLGELLAVGVFANFFL